MMNDKIYNRTEMMQLALKEARQAFEEDEVPVGAALFDKNGYFIASDHNRMVQNNDPTAHAELNVVKKSCTLLEKTNLKDYILCITLEPCSMCASAIAWAKVGEVRFGAYDTKSGGVISGARIFDQDTCHHRPDLYGGLFEDESARLLKTFFEKKRSVGSL